MGEEAVSSGEAAMDLELKAEGKISSKKEDSSVSVVRWERFLPRMVLRVMLVEADDSTRQIITALLRKCGYRVAAVSDGLKAWELLKGKPHNVDLILTEVELPSISGFALLTLIGEHEICKNIPVIMMSSKDSVTTVYKCMMRGAADFLVKPVRKNELRILWQHVWRRQVSSSGGNGPQDESVAQQKVEATAENNYNNAANHSSEIMACIQRNRECIEKGSDAQSSCTKPDLEVERGCPENVHDLSPSTLSKSPVRGMDLPNHQECDRSNRKPPMSDCEDRGCVAAACEDAKAMTQGDDVASEIGMAAHYHITDEGCYDNHAPVNSSREAIDLIGAFENSPKCGHRNSFSDNGPSKVDSSPLLDLSLMRSNPSGSVNQVSDGRPTLNHSDASAFSRYINKAVQPPGSSVTMCNEQKDNGTERQFSHHMPNYSSYPNGFSLSTQQNMFSLETKPESAFPCPQRKVFPVPVKGIRFDGLCNPYGSLAPPIFCAQSGHEQLSHQVNVFHSPNLETRNSQQQLHKIVQVNADTSTNQTELQQRQELESSADRRYFSSAADQSGSSGFCNGTTTNHLNGIGCGSNGNIDQVPVVRAAAGSGNGEGVPTHDTNCHRSFQREAALNKFRMKRKDRCFDKKVRYESRKKLAEQRPRVKGQFVRHAQNELLLTESDRQ